MEWNSEKKKLNLHEAIKIKELCLYLFRVNFVFAFSFFTLGMCVEKKLLPASMLV